MLRIEDYGLIGDTQTSALVGRDGSIDWLCLPSFDSPACFAALLGAPAHGRWLVAPASGPRLGRQRYRPETLILETEFETVDGAVRVIDFMPPRHTRPDLIRIVEGIRGSVPMAMELVIRFDYGRVVPWVRRIEGHLQAIAGPDALVLWSEAELEGRDLTTRAEFVVDAGATSSFELVWHPSELPPPGRSDPAAALEDTAAWWGEWVAQCTYEGPWRDEVVRSLVTLKALTYAPTGGIVAAPTTSLPEAIGGVRNWDYRFCWLRDAAYVLYAFVMNGFMREAADWRNWLLRAIAGDPSTIQATYDVHGRRRLTELELGWLPGYAGSRPVRTGNDAARQFQLDVYGEVMDAIHVARGKGLDDDHDAWELQKALLGHLEKAWRRPDEGIWEVRGPRRHFTHSRVMAYVAFDRAVKGVERFGLDGPVDRWRALRTEIRQEVLTRGFSETRRSFRQHYGSDDVDASLLLLPLVGFLPATDPRMVGTVRAVETDLCVDGLVRRYRTTETLDGLPSGEGAFLACSFWLADNYVLQGRHEEARGLFERLLARCNGLGLLAEEYDPVAGRMLGNFPQAFSHVMLVNTACNLTGVRRPAAEGQAEVPS